MIEHTWLAFASTTGLDPSAVAAGIERVGVHYASLQSDRPRFDSTVSAACGMALWQRPDPRRRWPLWAAQGGGAIALTEAPTGWSALIGDAQPAHAALPLARALIDAPERASELNPPFVAGVRADARGELVIVNDCAGVGRLYEMRIGDLWVWSNRLGALPLFAGVPPEADQRAWRIFAAAGWFLGDTTPIAGAVKVPPATVIRIRDQGRGASVERVEGDVQRRLTEPRRARLGPAAEEAAESAAAMARDLDRIWSCGLAIALTGGRDSRVSAAAALAAEIDATYNTGDHVPGEVDVVRDLIAAAPRPMEHDVTTPEPDEDPEDDLGERIHRIHLVHDGMRNPQELRRPTELPHAAWLPPALSGHGGELAHGFYYPERRKLRRLRRGGDAALARQLERNARRNHSAALEAGYEEYLVECRRSLDLGRSHGIDGPTLLDWFYLAQRLPYRSGLGARSARASACVTPAFIRGAFDLAPRERLRARLHREVIGRLVPQWRRIEFFASDSAPMPESKRRRIWERPREAAAVGAMIRDAVGWPEILRAERIEEMWSEVRTGRGSADYEHVFDRLVWRVGYERHLEELGRAALSSPPAATVD